MADERNRSGDMGRMNPDSGQQDRMRDMDDERVRGGAVDDVRGIAGEDEEEFEDADDDEQEEDEDSESF